MTNQNIESIRNDARKEAGLRPGEDIYSDPKKMQKCQRLVAKKVSQIKDPERREYLQSQLSPEEKREYARYSNYFGTPLSNSEGPSASSNRSWADDWKTGGSPFDSQYSDSEEPQEEDSDREENPKENNDDPEDNSEEENNDDPKNESSENNNDNESPESQSSENQGQDESPNEEPRIGEARDNSGKPLNKDPHSGSSPAEKMPKKLPGGGGAAGGEAAAAAGGEAAAAASAAAAEGAAAGAAATSEIWLPILAVIFIFLVVVFFFTSIASKYGSPEVKDGSVCISADGHAFPIEKDKVNYSDGFGDDRGDHLHSGTDLMHTKGDKVKIYAIANAEVVYVNTDSNGVSLKLKSTTSGDSNYYYYTHMSSASIKGGDKVTAGQLIGESAGTNLGSVGDHLHISIGTVKDFKINLPLGSGAKHGQTAAPSPYQTTLNPYPILKAINEGSSSCNEDGTANANPVSGNYKELQKKWHKYKNQGYILQDRVGVTQDVDNAIVKESTLRTVITVVEYAKSKDLKIRISVFKTGHRPGTWHEKGYAFDIANEEVAKELMPWMYKNRSVLKLNELIFNNSNIASSPNYYNLDEGRKHNYNSSTLSGHKNHIHVATY